MPRPQTPEGVDRPRLRRFGAGLMSLTAMIATSLVAGPASGVPASGPCTLTRAAVHHSEGVDSWNTAYPRPERELDAVMIFLAFPDAEPRFSPSELAADYFPDTTRFFDRASYGRFRLRAHPQQTWIRMPEEATSYEIRRDWDPDLRSRYLRDAVDAADASVDFTRYDIVYLVADPEAPGVDPDATKVVNFDRPLRADGEDLRRIVTLFERHPPDRNVLAHETGHVFDLPDLYHRPEDGRADWDTHVGDWDLMGSQFGLAPEPFGWHKWKLGWLREDQVTCVPANSTTLSTLDPLTAPVLPGTSGGKRLLMVRTGESSVLAIEARGASGNDAEICAEGVLVYRVHSEKPSGEGPIEVLDGHPDTAACRDTSVHPTLADAALGIGESLLAREDAVRVTVEGRSEGGGWTVKIARRTEV